jgi:hypothetical protein
MCMVPATDIGRRIVWYLVIVSKDRAASILYSEDGGEISGTVLYSGITDK